MKDEAQSLLRPLLIQIWNAVEVDWISREIPLLRQPGAKENNPEGGKVSSSSSRRHPFCERVQGLGYIDHEVVAAEEGGGRGGVEEVAEEEARVEAGREDVQG